MNIAKKVRLHCQKAFSKGEKAYVSGTFDSVGEGYALIGAIYLPMANAIY